MHSCFCSVNSFIFVLSFHIDHCTVCHKTAQPDLIFHMILQFLAQTSQFMFLAIVYILCYPATMVPELSSDLLNVHHRLQEMLFQRKQPSVLDSYPAISNQV